MRYMIDKVPAWRGKSFELRIISGLPVMPGDKEVCGKVVLDQPFYVESFIAKQVKYDSRISYSACEIPPVLSLDETEAQQLIDQLWDAGVRPTNGAGSVGQLAATEKHLNDMRALVFKTEMPK